jgi:hypothetical protein
MLAHNLKIEAGRYTGIKKNQIVSSQSIESEYDFYGVINIMI